MIRSLIAFFRGLFRRPAPGTIKLYLIVRADLPPGLQAAQLVHAATVLCLEQTAAAMAWHRGVQNVVCLAAPNESELAQHARETAATGRQVATFHEPDLDGQLTAIAVLGEGLFPGLPLALRPTCYGCRQPVRKCACDAYERNGGRPRAASC
jgi:peptidyl-tRNA hydrolase